MQPLRPRGVAAALVATGLVGALLVVVAIVVWWVHAATAEHRPYRFVPSAAHTSVRPGKGGRVVVPVRVLSSETGRPAHGRVWLEDVDGPASAPVRLSRSGRAVLSAHLPPGTTPGRHAYRFDFRARGGGDEKSRARVAVRVPMPPRDHTVDATWAAAPDVTNEDIGNLAGMPGYKAAYGNSWDPQIEHSVNWVYRTIASYDPGALLISGDLVEGRWGNPANTSGLFGSPHDLVAMFEHQAAFYHGQNVRRLKRAGLFDKTYPAVGDHDLGDNPWGNGTFYGRWKREHLDLWRASFNREYLHHTDGRPKYFSRPLHSEWDKTAYASMINPETLLVTLDVFDRQPTRVGVHVVGAQLHWLDRTLAAARRRGVRWIIVQGHTPVLPARTFHSSGLHISGGATSPLWKTLVKYHVNVYLAGEVHSTSRMTKDGVTQLVTGAPVATGDTSFATVKEYHDRMQIAVRGWHLPRNAPHRPLWAGGCSVPVMERGSREADCAWSRLDPGDTAYAGIKPKMEGRLTVYLDGRTDHGSGLLTPYTGPGFSK